MIAVLAVLGTGAIVAALMGSNGDGGPVAGSTKPGVTTAPGEGSPTTTAPVSTDTTPAQTTSDDPPGPLPAGSDAQFADDITTLLLDFHRAVVSRNYRGAWELLSARKRAQFLREDGYPKWRMAQASLTPWLEPDGLRATIAAVDRPTGVARVRISGMGWSRPRARCSTWSGLTWVKFEDGAWRYDPGYSTTKARKRAWKARYGQLLGGRCTQR